MNLFVRTRVTPAPRIRKRGKGRVTAQMRGHRVANRENLAYCFTVCPSGGLPSSEVEEYCRVPSRRGDVEKDKQVPGHNKGVSIHRRTLFICKRSGRPSVRIISLDFPRSSSLSFSLSLSQCVYIYTKEMVRP